MVINNQTIGFDPQPGTWKKCVLHVIYVDEDRDWESTSSTLFEWDKFPAEHRHDIEIPEIRPSGR